MTQRRLILVLALLATAAWTGAAFGQATLSVTGPIAATLNLTNGDVVSADPVKVEFTNVTLPATLEVWYDTESSGNPSGNYVCLKWIDSNATTWPSSPVRVRFAMNHDSPGVFHFGARIVDAVGTVVAWGTCTVNYTCWFHNCWQSYSDGSMNTYNGGSPGEGYATSSEGNYRLAKAGQHYGFMAFGDDDPNDVDGLSDSLDGFPPNHPGHHNPGPAEGACSTMVDWLNGKKLVSASLYWRDASEVCSTFNDPTEIIGFRVANDGKITDRPTQGTGGFGGCCAGYTSPLVDAGMSAPPAWRMGAPWKDWTAAGGGTGYDLKGDAGEFAADHEWYKVSNFDTTSPNKKGLEVVASAVNTWFSNPYTPYPTGPDTTVYDKGGWTAHPRNATGGTMSGAGRFAFGWLVEVSNAHLVNSLAVNLADCTATAEPRDANLTGALDDGWFGQKLDNGLIYALAHRTVSEVKAIVFSAYKVATYNNPSAYGRDQGGGYFSPYVYVWKATYNGDCALPLNGCVDDADLLAFAAAFGNSPYDAECDFNYDGNVDISDLLALAVQWTNCIPGAPF